MIYRVTRITTVLLFSCFGTAAVRTKAEDPAPHSKAPSIQTPPDVRANPFRAETSWDDGLAEMSYYRATDSIYDKEREYTRVVIVNREWFSPITGVKAEPPTGASIAALKMNIAEEIPTENYNYRFLTTLFARRDDLRPLKLVVSSQEWCGASYKHLRWKDDGLQIQSHSYVSGDHTWTIGPSAVPYEALFLLARDAAAARQPMPLRLLAPQRTTRMVPPTTVSAVLLPGVPTSISVPLGEFQATAVTLKWDGPATTFIVESEAPFRVLRYECGTAKGELQSVERRAYWDRKWESKAYLTGEAP